MDFIILLLYQVLVLENKERLHITLQTICSYQTLSTSPRTSLKIPKILNAFLFNENYVILSVLNSSFFLPIVDYHLLLTQAST